MRNEGKRKLVEEMFGSMSGKRKGRRLLSRFDRLGIEIVSLELFTRLWRQQMSNRCLFSAAELCDLSEGGFNLFRLPLLRRRFWDRRKIGKSQSLEPHSLQPSKSAFALTYNHLHLSNSTRRRLHRQQILLASNVSPKMSSL